MEMDVLNDDNNSIGISLPDKFTWCWTDDEGSYINKSHSLLDIVDTVLNYYFNGLDEDAECDEIDKIIRIKIDSEYLKIYIRTEDNEVQSYEIIATINSVCDFLKDIAWDLGRPDFFAIQEI